MLFQICMMYSVLIFWDQRPCRCMETLYNIPITIFSSIFNVPDINFTCSEIETGKSMPILSAVMAIILFCV